MSVRCHHQSMMRVGSSWTPADLAVPPSLWLNDTSPQTISGGFIITLGDLSGNGWYMGSNSDVLPISNMLNGRGGFDTSANNPSYLQTEASISAAKDIYKNQPQGWMFAMFKYLASSPGGAPDEYAMWTGANSTGNTRFAMTTDFSGTKQIGIRTRRDDTDSASQMFSGITLDNNFHMYLITMDWSVRTGTIYIDGTQVAQNTTLTSAGSATSNTSAVDPLAVGFTSPNTSAFMNGGEYMMGRTIPTPSEVVKLFNYARTRWGL